MNIKELSEQPEKFTSGHRLCAGCGAGIIARMVLSAVKEPVVVANATGCLEVASTIYPYTAWNVPWIHNAFENAAATISGVESAYNVLKQKKKKPFKLAKDVKFIAFGGDGGTYDIGLQSLSGALERGHKFLYVCYDNGSYANTGVQRSSATPYCAETTTTPYGKKIPGKETFRKNLTEIVAAHSIPYVAQAGISHWFDLVQKVQKAIVADGPSFINILSPCSRGWNFNSSQTVKIADLAVQTNFWPLYEIEKGKYKINYQPQKRKPIKQWLSSQGRFRHLLKPENKHLVKEIQEKVDKDWEDLKNKTKLK
jgi:pyruvate ferredoxin oxidoreductase beta subunit